MHKILVLQSDFGIVDGAVSAMIGVALSVDDTIRVFDLSHSITPFDIYEASYRLFQSLQYWPKGSVFVSVVDPGVGSERSSVAVLTRSGHIVVTPNNGSLSHLKRFIGLEEIHLIDVEKNRRQGAPNQSYTFDGRDLYAYVGARLASEIIDLSDVGPKIEEQGLVELELPESRFENGQLTGSVEILDERYGSIWTSILVEDFLKFKPSYGETFSVTVMHENVVSFQENVTYGRAFNTVAVGELVLYVSSLSRMAIAINQGNLSETYAIQTGLDWIVTISRI
jgi:S-adenosylmethionine hydrolase